jgi:thiol-disulfide isomerase/thioredoxin
MNNSIPSMRFRAAIAVAALSTFALACPNSSPEDSQPFHESARAEGFAFPEPANPRLADAEEYWRMAGGHRADLLVVNFWATWCAPCVEELPDFISAFEATGNGNVAFVGVSLDFVDRWEKVVPPFLEEKKIPYPVIVLDADPTVFVDSVSTDWSGAIPATFFYNSEGKKVFQHFGMIGKDELLKAIESHS